MNDILKRTLKVCIALGTSTVCTLPILSHNFIVTSGSTVSVAAGTILTVGGNYTNSGTVTLESTSSTYSQLKISGSASGNIVQSQYLEAGSHLVSSPVSQGFTTTSGDKTKLYSYDAAAGNWSTIGANFATAGLGFAARVDASQIPFLTAAANASVTGTPNT